MILVTVGTHNRGFDRLVRAADELAAQIEEPVVIQYGSSAHEPGNATRAFRFTSGSEMQALSSQARVIITHAAAGALILGLRMMKPLIVVPRLKKYYEVMSDHQIELASALASQNRVVMLMQPTGNELIRALGQIKLVQNSPVNQTELVNALRSRLCQWGRDQGAT